MELIRRRCFKREVKQGLRGHIENVIGKCNFASLLSFLDNSKSFTCKMCANYAGRKKVWKPIRFYGR